MSPGLVTKWRPTLVVKTVAFENSDQEKARQIGRELYNSLTRPLNDPLSYGAGIPVFSCVSPEEINAEEAENVVVIPVLGTIAFSIEQKRFKALDQINEWYHELGTGHVLPLFVDKAWRSIEDELLGTPLLSALTETLDSDRATLDEIILAISRLLAGDDKANLFISHAKADLTATREAAKRISDHVKTNTTGTDFFDRTELLSGESIENQIDFALKRGVFVAVRGDCYSSRTWCQKEFLKAKSSGLPTITVEILNQGEERSLAYGGNGPTIVWNNNPEDVASRAMIEWVRSEFFRQEAERISSAAGLPETKTLVRPPELLDLAQGPLRLKESQLVMYPDPELPVLERQVLQSVNHRLNFVTPLTAFRRVLSREIGSADAPLEGIQVAMSLSNSPDVNGAEGFTEKHVEDITVSVARSLISAGAAIAYGGDFREGGYTFLLSELVRTYNQTAVGYREFLHCYPSAHIALDTVPKNLPVTSHYMAYSDDVVSLAKVPGPTTPEGKMRPPNAIYLSDMRQVMAMKTKARVLIGGNAEPRIMEEGNGYGGIYPGIVEEAWCSLVNAQPIYVIGGFGGAAQLIANLMEDRPIPERLQDKTWLKHNFYRENVDRIKANSYFEMLAVPGSMEEIGKEIKKHAQRLLNSDKVSLAWNGLTVEENRSLFKSRDSVLINSLVMRGILNVSQLAATGKLEIEVVNGLVTDALDLDAIAVGTFDDVPLGGAGAAIDEMIGGRATMERAIGKSLVSVGDRADIDADWIFLASLGQLDTGDMAQKIRDAANQVKTAAQRHGLRRLGIVAFGGNVLSDLNTVVDSMLAELILLAGFARITWFESNEQRFDELRQILLSNDQLKMTTRRIDVGRVQLAHESEALVLNVGYLNEELTVMVLPANGNAMVGTNHELVTRDQVDRLAAGTGTSKKNTPDMKTIEARGHELASLLLGDKADKILAHAADSKLVVIHDGPSSKFPFEIIGAAGTSPASNKGISRRLAVKGVPIDRLFTRPPKTARINLLLVINPTKDLPGTAKEGKVIQAVLSQRKNVNVIPLNEEKATKAALLDALPFADVLHYCGHAFFDGPGETESGLVLAGRENFTLADVRGIDMPRVAFVNACEAGRVRALADIATEAASFAEFFLRSGVEAYLGTFWTVNDKAAELFAENVYAQLASGKTLDESVTISRRELKNQKFADWANYLLYGDGRFRLIDRLVQT